MMSPVSLFSNFKSCRLPALSTMPVTTTSAAVHLTPVVLETFFTHARRKAKRLKERQSSEDELPQDDIFYDQAFHIVKAFLKLGTHNTVESLQQFTNTHVPSPYWAAVAPVLVPLASCNKSADCLIEWFGQEELQKVVGGERWWQVRGLDGIEAEWVTEKKYLGQLNRTTAANLTREEETICRMDELDTVMLYVHGGGYFWGSMNTHRYQVLRFARKFRGRAFSVNYRKAPQYPWPCAIQDVLAAYLYLTDPPAHALHTAIPPSKITLAGDSAGGGICLTVLTILRDLSKPLPAGAVLISPWVDLMHSFPSILQNTETDIIPEAGFLAKPSTLWPLDLLPPDSTRIVPTKNDPPPFPGEADTLKPSRERIDRQQRGEDKISTGLPVKSQDEMLSPAGSHPINIQDTSLSHSLESNNISSTSINNSANNADIDFWEPKPPKVLMQNPHAILLELHSQIQMYATNEQLSHPLVSPVFQGSLGGLPPLFIIAGDGELLRDEAIYLAHRAVYPTRYPASKGTLRDGRRQKENATKFTKGTKVHLQIYDGMCHVPTIFNFADNVRFAYRSIAEFIIHVTRHDSQHLEKTPFPETCHSHTVTSSAAGKETIRNHSPQKHRHDERIIREDAEDAELLQRAGFSLGDGSAEVQQSGTPSPLLGNHTGSGSQMPENSNVHMIRQRINFRGKPRAMEPAKDIPALKFKSSEVGIMKEAPALRWKRGQDKWDRRYRKAAITAIVQRRKWQMRAEQMLRDAYEQGLTHSSNSSSESEGLPHPRRQLIRETSVGEIQIQRRWGPLDLEEENPPHSAIAKRLDTPDAVALLKKHIYFTAPITHKTIPRMKPSAAIRATLDPTDDPNKPPRQSASEQQAKAHIFPVHGLRLWDSILRHFRRKTTVKIGSEHGLQHSGTDVER